MSSSRSIAAARNRRAGEPPSTNSRPGTSINSQPAFSSKSQSQSQSQSKFQQNVTVQNSTPNVPVSNTKLTISDAIGLITLRLGRVEQILQDAEHNGGTSNSIPNNAHLIDKSVINSIVNRLDALEKKEKESSSNNKFDSEIRTIKDLLMAQILKYDKNSIDIDKKLSDIDAAFFEIEKVQEIQDNTINDLINRLSVESLNTDVIKEEIKEEIKDVIQEKTIDLQTTDINFDLKNAVSEELANAGRF